MKNKLAKAIFAAMMANTHVTLKLFYKMKGQEPPSDETLMKEVDKLYERYFHRYEFASDSDS